MLNTIPDKNNICCIIITYHPDIKFAERLQRILTQLDNIVIVDNNSDINEVNMLRELCTQYNIELIENCRNMGIATALNQGIDRAQVYNYKWALLFDQDTIVIDGMIQELIDVYQSCDFKQQIGIIGSNYYDLNSSIVNINNKTMSGNKWIEMKTVITSGSLLSIPVFSKVGRFRDEFFIDSVDLEYCLRVHAKGYRVITTVKPITIHSLGRTTMHSVLWKKTGTSNHSALRRYYMVRNNLVLIKEYIFKEPIWAYKTIVSLIKRMLLVILFEQDKVTKVKFMLRGLICGILNKMGSYKDS